MTSCRTGKQKEYSSEIGENINHEILFSDNNERVTHFLLNRPAVQYCKENHRHFVDIVAKYKIDSLNGIGVKDILYYRDWIGTNSFNGYGKLIWWQNDKYFQYQLNFENYDGRYGISSIDKSEMKISEAMDIYISNRIDTVQSSPKESEYRISHAADHFVYANINGHENCFHVSGLNLMADSTHIKSQIIKKLRIPKRDYFKMIDSRRKKK